MYVSLALRKLENNFCIFFEFVKLQRTENLCNCFHAILSHFLQEKFHAINLKVVESDSFARIIKKIFFQKRKRKQLSKNYATKHCNCMHWNAIDRDLKNQECVCMFTAVSLTTLFFFVVVFNSVIASWTWLFLFLISRHNCNNVAKVIDSLMYTLCTHKHTHVSRKNSSRC